MLAEPQIVNLSADILINSSYLHQVKICLCNSNTVVTFLSGLSKYDDKVTIILMVEYKLCKHEENKRLCFQARVLWLSEKADFFFFPLLYFLQVKFSYTEQKNIQPTSLTIHLSSCISVVVSINYHLSNTALQS